MKVLLVRNDNIGDLICSIPAIQLVRRQNPQAELHLLVNSYNAPVVECLTPGTVNRLVVYHKIKHVGLGWNSFFQLGNFYWNLFSEGYTHVILLVGGHSRQSTSFAKWTRAKNIYGYHLQPQSPQFISGLHEVEYSWKLAESFCGIKAKLPSCIHYPIQRSGNEVGIQISSRKKGNQWDTHHFVELVQKIADVTQKPVRMFWSPGSKKTLTHPGDDEKATEIADKAGTSIKSCPTSSLRDLINELQNCQSLITPDGGAMHLASAMGIRIVSLFGPSEIARWRPWTPHATVLKSSSNTINDILVKDVFDAWQAAV